ncbi:hypothetical protein Enr13x_73850 [Stieleria neptunia]|uniref:Planctomycete cytochrome C n=1 Tax=Stieleria neptunia TaxID=2527979 RepID=A0A518I338_9BACT|nr:DUF1592 domain-containing protein [Stieleria neptunia]QDV47476.1 hypothetical protein Enr13x_73850 [Stieleria neptunia]
MTRIVFTICITSFSLCSLAQAAPPEASLPEKHRAFFIAHCLDCHDSETQEEKVDLETLPLSITTIEQAELWQRVLNALNAGEMPPDDSEQPGNTEKADFLDDLARTMVTARQALSDSGGKITMRRLNQREYRNTIEHLTGAHVDVGSLPSDGGSGTFDTVGASQFISSDQFEQYLKLGRSAIDEAFERRKTTGRETNPFRVEPETTVNPANEKEIANIEDEYARFTRWQKGVDAAAKTPQNQARIAEIRKTDRLIDHPIRFYAYADRLEETPDPKDFGFRDSPKAASGNPEGDRRNLAYHKHYAALPHRDRGTYLKLAHGTGRIIVPPKKTNLSPGSYVIRVRVGAVEGTPAERRFIQVGHPQRQIESRNWGLEGRAISTHQVTGTIENPETIEIPLEVTANTIREFAVQEKQPNNGNLKALWDAHNRWKKENGYGHPPAIWIDWVELEGPIANASGPSAFTASWAHHDADREETPRARKILEQFAQHAFRDVSPEPEFIDRLVRIFQTRLAAGDSFDVAIRKPLSVILASPGFLYLYEPGDEALRRQLDDRELAVRLSYFLWSGPPDAELLELAEKNELHIPETLRQQVDRLIDDPRSNEFVAGFVHQWLDMERLDFFQFDVNLYRDFDESTRAATRKEVYQSFAHLLRDKGSGRIGKLIKSDYVFVNGLLATYYGIEGVTGDEFRKIKLPADSPRGGLLGMAAIHAMGSDGIVSSPVERGAWVLRHLLNDPPPPAPPNVPQISRLNDQILTTRERLLAHQEEAQCASCHRKIDPIGFGLENWGAAGKWRTTDHAGGKGKNGKTWTIDASGAFHKGPAFSDYNELRDLIAEREEDFARGFAEHLIEYASGRPFGFTDEDLASEMVSSAKSKQFALSEFVHALVQHKAFKTK